MQGDAGSPVSLVTQLGGLVGGVFAAIWQFLHPVLQAIDPLCGPAGLFSLLFSTGQLACGDTGWGDEIAFGFYVTTSLALCTLPLGLLLGFFLALAKQSPERYLRASADIYTTLFRGLPELLTLFIIYYGMQEVLQRVLARMGYEGAVEINTFVAGMIAVGIVFSAYCSEVLLSAFRAIPRGQYEGGSAIGLSGGQTMRLVILPQLVRIALPGLGNLWMTLLKDTALVSIIGLPDILRQTSVAARVTKNAFFFHSIACLLFLFLAILSSVVLSNIESRARRSEARS